MQAFCYTKNITSWKLWLSQARYYGIGNDYLKKTIGIRIDKFGIGISYKKLNIHQLIYI